MTLNDYDLENSYAPSTLMSLVPEILGKMISVRGVYKKDNKNNKGNPDVFTDMLCDENSDTSLTVEISNKLRKVIKSGKSYYFKGVLALVDKRKTKGDVKFILDDFHERKIDKGISVLSEKMNLGFRQPDVTFRNKLQNNETPEIAVILSKSKVIEIESEINTKLADYLTTYNFSTFKTDFTTKKSLTDVISKIKKYKNDFDAIVLINSDVEQSNVLFDDDTIAQKLMMTKYPLITASAYENSLIERISDKKFNAPAEFGQYLYEIANEINDEVTKTEINGDSVNEILSLQKELTKANKTIEKLEETVEKLSSDVEKDDDKYAELLQAKSSIEQKVQEALDQIVDYETKKIELEDEIKRLSNDLNNETIENTALNNLLHDLQSANADLTEKLTNNQTEIDQNSKELSNQIMKRMQIEDKYNELNQYISRMESDKKLVEENKNKLATDLEELTEKHQMLTKIIQDMKDQSIKREKKIAELTAQFDQKQNALQNLQLKSDDEFEKMRKKYFTMMAVFSAIALALGLVVGFIL